jgi:hypothetical protein
MVLSSLHETTFVPSGDHQHAFTCIHSDVTVIEFHKVTKPAPYLLVFAFDETDLVGGIHRSIMHFNLASA